MMKILWINKLNSHYMVLCVIKNKEYSNIFRFLISNDHHIADVDDYNNDQDDNYDEQFADFFFQMNSNTP